MKRSIIASAITLALAPFLTLDPAGAAAAAPAVTLTEAIPLPAIHPGDFDQFAVDETRNRLYLSAEANGAVEVFDLRTGALLRSGGPVKSPHKVIVDPQTGRIFVADGKDSSIKVLDENLALIAKIPTGADPDGGVYDERSRIFYVGSRAVDPAAPGSEVTAISTATLSVVGTVPVASAKLKTMVIDPATDRLFVSMRDKSQVGVISLKAHAVVAVWSAEALNQNVPLAFDQADNLLFVGSRRPGKLFALDGADGHVVKLLDSTETSDSMSYDPDSRRLYLSGTSGLSVYHVGGRDDITQTGLYDTGAAKTSLLVASLHRLYAARPKTEQQDAALLLYAVAP